MFTMSLIACNLMQEKNMAVLKKFIDAVCSCFIESKSNGCSDAFDNIKSCVKFLGKLGFSVTHNDDTLMFVLFKCSSLII